MKVNKLIVLVLFLTTIVACDPNKENVQSQLPDDLSEMLEMKMKLQNIRNLQSSGEYVNANAEQGAKKYILSSDGDTVDYFDSTNIYSDTTYYFNDTVFYYDDSTIFYIDSIYYDSVFFDTIGYYDSAWYYSDTNWYYGDTTWYGDSTYYSDSLYYFDSTYYWVDSGYYNYDTTYYYLDSTDTYSDTLGFGDCAEVNTYVDAEGYTVTETDYGVEGCNSWGMQIKGKIISKFKIEGNVEFFEEEYINYEVEGMVMNGKYGGSTDGTMAFDSSTFDTEDFEIIYSSYEDITISYDNGETIRMISNYKEKCAYAYHIVMEGSFSYVTAEESYTYEIIEPVYTDFSCKDSFIPVKGIEEWSDGEETYRIDYGDGNCDNLVTITHNGETSTYDYADGLVEF